MLPGGAFGFVNTSANCLSEFAHLVLTPVALICCRVAEISKEVRRSDPESPNPRDSLPSSASSRLLQSVMAKASGNNCKTASGCLRSMPAGWRQSAKNKRIKLSMSIESAMACDSALRELRHFRPSFHDFQSMIPTGASCPLCKACEVAYIRKPPCEEPSGRTPQAASLKMPKLNSPIGTE